MKREIIEINDINSEGVEIFGALTEKGLRRRYPHLFIAESPKVILRGLENGWKPVSLLREKGVRGAEIEEIMRRCPDNIPVYEGERETLARMRGFHLMRGMVCAMERREHPTVKSLLEGARRIVVMDGVCDAENVGSIFRSCAALGVDSILMVRGSCDPLNRRSVRVSMGGVFQIKWGWVETIDEIKREGFKIAALALKKDSVTLENEGLQSENRLALLLGEEGYGLRDECIAKSDYTVCIPMKNNVDSLNVAATASIAIYALVK